jgi:uncharacterized protein YyaL (SSP411 family)
MARAGRAFGRPEWTASARRALEFIRLKMWHAGRLVATYKDGRAHLNAYLDDYAFLVAALLEMMQTEFLPADLDFAEELADVLLDQFEDAEGGGFFFTARDHERLIHELFFPAMRDYPAGFGAMAIALEESLQPPNILVLRGKAAVLEQWKTALAGEYLPDTAVLAIGEGVPGLPASLDKPAAGNPASQPVNGWLCRGVTCLPPISDLVHLKKALKEKV